MATIFTVYEFLAKRLSYWSAEFTALIGVCVCLMSLGLLDLWVIKTILTICVFLFLGGMAHKFILTVYSQHIKLMKEIKEKGVDNE